MDSDTGYQVIILILLVIASAFFSASETALLSLSKIRIRHMVDEKVKNADIVSKLTESSSKFLSTILVSNTAINVGISAIATSLSIKAFSGNGVVIATVVTTILLLLFVEITPKSIAAQNSEIVSLKFSKAISFFVFILYPIVFVFNKISGIFMMSSKKKHKTLITEEELKTIVDVSEEEGVLEVQEKEMIYNVFEFGDQQIKDIMINRTDVTSIDIDTTYKQILDMIKRDKYSRIPVYNETIDNIVGILNIKDLVTLSEDEKNNFDVSKYMREPYFTYEYKGLSELFNEMKKERVHIAIVLDEYGGTAGIVTVEDIIEEIVGDIEDEYDEEEDEIKVVKEDEYIVDGSARIELVNEMLGTSFESEDFDSIGGFVIGILGRFPNNGEVIEKENVKFVIEDLDNNRIKKIRIFT